MLGSWYPNKLTAEPICELRDLLYLCCLPAIIVLLDWFSPLLRIVCSKVVKESDLKWVPMKGRNNVKLLFVQDPQGFTPCGSILRKAIPKQKIDVLIADSDYGIKEEP